MLPCTLLIGLYSELILEFSLLDGVCPAHGGPTYHHLPAQLRAATGRHGLSEVSLSRLFFFSLPGTRAWIKQTISPRSWSFFRRVTGCHRSSKAVVLAASAASRLRCGAFYDADPTVTWGLAIKPHAKNRRKVWAYNREGGGQSSSKSKADERRGCSYADFLLRHPVSYV